MDMVVLNTRLISVSFGALLCNQVLTLLSITHCHLVEGHNFIRPVD